MRNQQAHPPSEAQQLADARKATEAAQALADHWQCVADTQRTELDALEARLLAYRRAYGALHSAARAVIQNAARDVNYTDEVRVVGADVLGELARCVSSNGGDMP